MVSKSKKENAGKKKKVKVLNLNKETVKNLTGDEARAVKGGTTVCIVSLAKRGQSLVAETLSCIAGNSIGGFNL